jgi:hypothetical protein
MIEIKSMEPQHWNEVRKIYEEGLSTGNATFQTIWFFISLFYRENRWMMIFALANLLLAVIIHMPRPAAYKSFKKS